MNATYLAKTLKTESLAELYANMDLPPLDANLAIWDAIDRGELEVDEGAETIKILKDVDPSSDDDLRNKLIRTMQHYAKSEININRGRLNPSIKDPMTGKGYLWHEYLMAVQHLLDDGTIEERVVDVPEGRKMFTKKNGKQKERVARPAHKFAFLCLTENSAVNDEWNAREINKWIAQFDKS